MSSPIQINHEQALSLYRQGLSDEEIAQGLTGIICSRWVIRVWRKKNKLLPNRFGARHRQKLSIFRKEQFKREGIALGRKTRALDCIKSIDLGWSVPLTRRERRIAECLLDGEKTMVELRLLIGQKTLDTALLAMKKQGYLTHRRLSDHKVLYKLTESCGRATPSNLQ